MLKSAPCNVHALHGMGQSPHWRADSTRPTRRSGELSNSIPRCQGLGRAAATRKMTSADGEWFENAEEIVSSGIHPLAEANLRFAMGKFFDDVNDYERAFQNFKRGNELLKSAAKEYDRTERSRLIDELIRSYSPKAISELGSLDHPRRSPCSSSGCRAQAPRSPNRLSRRIRQHSERESCNFGIV